MTREKEIHQNHIWVIYLLMVTTKEVHLLSSSISRPQKTKIVVLLFTYCFQKSIFDFFFKIFFLESLFLPSFYVCTFNCNGNWINMQWPYCNTASQYFNNGTVLLCAVSELVINCRSHAVACKLSSWSRFVRCFG